MKKGIAPLIWIVFGIIVLVTIAGCNSSPPPQQYANGSGNSNGGAQAGASGGTSGSSSGSGGSGTFSNENIEHWCKTLANWKGIEEHRGKTTCHLVENVNNVVQRDTYFAVYPTEFWRKEAMYDGSVYEKYFIDGRCAEVVDCVPGASQDDPEKVCNALRANCARGI